MLLRRLLLLPLAVPRATARAPRPALPVWALGVRPALRRLAAAAETEPPPPLPPLPERAGHIAALLAGAQPDLALAGALGLGRAWMGVC